MWETVELREIRIFLVLAEELHFGRTAERLEISQSRVSQAVRSLEEQLGRRLFDRTSRSVRLTPAGRELLERVRGPHAELREALAHAYRGDAQVDGVLRVGLGSPVTQGPHFVEIVGRFRERYPHCEVVISDELTAAWLSILRDGKIDMLTSWLPVHAPDLVCGPILNTEERVVLVARDHPLAKLGSVTLDDVAAFAVTPQSDQMLDEAIYETIIPRATPGGRPIPRLQRQVRTPADVLTLIALGAMVHPTVPSFLQHWGHPNIVAVPLDGMPPLRSALLWRRATTDARIGAFVEVARETLGAEQLS